MHHVHFKSQTQWTRNGLEESIWQEEYCMILFHRHLNAALSECYFVCYCMLYLISNALEWHGTSDKSVTSMQQISRHFQLLTIQIMFTFTVNNILQMVLLDAKECSIKCFCTKLQCTFCYGVAGTS